ACRLGRALIDADLARLHRPTGLVSPLGAALGGAVLAGLGDEAATSALGLAANTSSGLNAWPHWGGSEMYFHPGFAARNAVTCVELAEAGAYPSEGALDGEGGWFAAYRRGAAPRELRLFPEGDAEILAVYNKPVPACNFAQTASQAALRVAREVGASRGPVRSVVIRVPAAAAAYPGCDFIGPFERALQAKMSIQFCVAAALARGTVAESNYADLRDPEILRLVGRTRLAVDAELTARFPAAQGAEVEVGFAAGGRLSHRLDDVVPATPGEVRLRFRAAAEAVLGTARTTAVEAFVDSLDEQADAGRLATLCAPGKARARP
ncbi:MAG: MmgE/PrpD family protein, partial [Tistlia sp.]